MKLSIHFLLTNNLYIFFFSFFIYIYFFSSFICIFTYKTSYLKCDIEITKHLVIVSNYVILNILIRTKSFKYVELCFRLLKVYEN